ncbi:MAG: insulinase family protein, partial [Caldilineaceae bacterium]
AKGMGLFGGGGNNRSNRLHRALVEQDLVVDIDSSFRPTIDPFLFGFYATLAPGVSHAQVEEAIWHELTRLQTEEVSAAELTKAIKQTKTQFAFSSESVTNQAFWLGFSEVVASLEWLDTWLTQLSAVTAADVQRVAREYFAPARQTVGWYVPAAEIDAADLEDEA